MRTEIVYNNNGICWEHSKQMAAAGLRHGVTGRTGGVSRGAYKSLNLALHVGDDEMLVMENRRRLCSAAGLDISRLTTTQQTHEDNIIAVGQKETGRGSASYEDALAHTDALMTNIPGVPLMICTADCVPVVLYDPVHNACAVVHDGWRGTVLKLAAKTAFAMRLAYGSQPQDLLAYVGPSISVANFEVGEDACKAFADMGPSYKSCFHKINGKDHIDLWAANRIMLVEAGLEAAHIDVTGTCVFDDPERFFSYRHDDGTTGRMGTFAVLDNR